MAALPRSWLHLWSLLKSRLGHKPHPTQPFVPMAVLRDTQQAYKADAASAAAPPAPAPENTSRPAASHASNTGTTAVPPAPASRSAMACAAQRPPKLFVLPASRGANMPHSQAAAAMPHMAIAPPFVLSGRMADVCAQLEQWAAQEERWLRTG